MHLLRPALALAVLCAAAPVFAQDVVSSLVTPPSAAPGSTITVDLLRVNPGAVDTMFTAPEVLQGRLVAGARNWPVQLHARASAPTDIAAGAFASRSYSLALPADAMGSLILEVSQEASEGTPAMTLRAVVQVEAGGAPQVPAPNGVAPASPLSSVSPAAAQLQSTFTGRFSAHEPIYIVYGADEPSTKFQFSFKYRVLNIGSIEGQRPALKFGYTQRSLWELGSSSSPFYDTSYIPSLFMEWLAPAQEQGEVDSGISLLGVQGGFQHESNGQADPDSRSFNILFARTSFVFGPADGFHVVASPRLFTYIGGLSDNRELAKYRGHGDLQLTFGKSKGAALAYTGRVGTGFDHYTTQLDLTVPIRTRWLDFASYIMVQYFNGYGENLRDYNEKISTIRAGIALLR